MSKKIALTVCATIFSAGVSAWAQSERALGVDISYWNCGTGSGISQANWNTGFSTGNRMFAWIRATRGGTTGVDQPQGTPGGGSTSTLSRRYDDSRFIQNITRATASGMFSGPYHFARPDLVSNTGADEADHFMQMAGPWMRPGYMVPVFDQEAGQSERTGNELVQFSLDFSDRVYAVMQIRPGIYINGNYSSIFQGATTARRDALAKPEAYTPSVTGPAYPMLWDARYSDNTANWVNIPVQTGNPRTTYTLSSGYYGPWDDYGDSQPWSFWQYASVASIPGFNAVDSGIDVNVSQGDIEYVRNYLVPAVWWNNSNGDWSTLGNWNSGQAVVAPVPGAGQATPYATGPLPTPRLPGAAGSGSTSGQYDTVILERPDANITVTVSSGSHNVRKLYMREALNLTGGGLTINYNPTYRADDLANVLHGGPVSAQFSGPVTLGSSGSLSVHTLQVDTNRIFTLAGGTLAFNTIDLMPHGTVPAKILVSGNVNVNPLANVTSVIKKGAGSGSGQVDLGAGTRTILVGNGTAAVDLSVDVPISNGSLTKSGLGTMRLTTANSYAGGTTISQGTLLVNNLTGSGTGGGSVNVDGGILGGTGVILGAVNIDSGGTISPGTSIGTLTLGSVPTFNGTNLMEINRNAGSPLSDRIVLASGTLNFGGTLVVSNVGATLVGGEVFTNFSAGSYTGAFANTILPALNSGLNWYLGHLTTNGTIKVNRRPTVNMVTVTNGFSGVVQIPIATLVGNGVDADGDALSLSGFGATTNGVALTSDSTFLIYSNNVNVADRFEFTISDSRGGFATNVVNVAPHPIVTGEFAQQPISDGNSVTLHFSGTPGATYFVDRSTNLPPAWLTIWTNIAPESGLFDYTDDFDDLSEPPASSFYRLRW